MELTGSIPKNTRPRRPCALQGLPGPYSYPQKEKARGGRQQQRQRQPSAAIGSLRHPALSFAITSLAVSLQQLLLLPPLRFRFCFCFCFCFSFGFLKNRSVFEAPQKNRSVFTISTHFAKTARGTAQAQKNRNGRGIAAKARETPAATAPYRAESAQKPSAALPAAAANPAALPARHSPLQLLTPPPPARTAPAPPAGPPICRTAPAGGTWCRPARRTYPAAAGGPAAPRGS